MDRSDCNCAARMYGSLDTGCHAWRTRSYSLVGALSLYACFCNYSHSGNAGEECTACTAGKYMKARGIGQCKPCPENSKSEAAVTSAVRGQWKTGFKPNREHACAPCATNAMSMIFQAFHACRSASLLML